MSREFGQWLTDQYKTEDNLKLWKSRGMWPPFGEYNFVNKPLRVLAPTTYECDSYGGRSNLDTAAIVLETLSEIPDSVALISTFWHSLMFGDLGLYPEHNRLPNDLDVVVVAPGNQSWIFCKALNACKAGIRARNKFPPLDMFSLSIGHSRWPDIPLFVQLNDTLPHRRKESPNKPMLEIHPLSTLLLTNQEIVNDFMRIYSPFYIKSHGLTAISITSNRTNKEGAYYIFEQYPSIYFVGEKVLRLKDKSSQEHVVVLTAHKEPEARLFAVIGQRIALAATIASVGKIEPVEIDHETLRLIRKSIGLAMPFEKAIANKILRTLGKIQLVQDHLDSSASFYHKKLPRIPFPESSTTLRDALLNYLKLLGYKDYL